GILLRATVDCDRLALAVQQVLAGERAVAADLVPVLVGAVSAPPVETLDSPLTLRERSVLALLADGRANKEIAAQLFVSTATVKTHVAHIYRKLGAQHRYEAIERAVALGLLG